MPNSDDHRPIGVLLAAGRGKRMGGAKQFHPWPADGGEKPLVAAAFDAVAGACVETVVVLGHRAEDVQEALVPREYHLCLADPDAPMFASVQAGVKVALEHDATRPILLHPADHPEVAPATLEKLLQLAAEHPEWVIIPEYDARGGHPVIIPAGVAQSLLQIDCPRGLGHYWSEHPELCLRVSVEDETVVHDVDVRP